jgi:DNA-binding CsgD family transcriptional regulator
MQNHADQWFPEESSRGESGRTVGVADQSALSSGEQSAVMRAIRLCSAIQTLADYSAWLGRDVESLLHHRGWVCGLGGLRPDGFTATHWLASWDSNEQQANPRATLKTMTSPLLTRWLKDRKPQVYVRGVVGPATVREGDIFAPRQFDNAVLHCQLDPENKWSSVFSFVELNPSMNTDEGPGLRPCELLDILVPHLHATLCRLIAPPMADSDPPPNQCIRLTMRELDILRRIRSGCTNHEIAEALHKSVFTVNNHVVNVLHKLSAKNRTHAVSIAEEIGLLES